MTRADIKHWLKRYIESKKEKDRIENTLKQLKIDSDGIKAQALTGMPSGGGNALSVQESALIQLSEIESKWASKCEQIAETLDEISTVINSVEDGNERAVLWYKYIDGLRWEDIAYIMNYSWRNLHYIHARALNTIASFHCFSQ